MVAPISSNLQQMGMYLYGDPLAGMNAINNSISAFDSMAQAYPYMNPQMFNNSAYDVNSAQVANDAMNQNSQQTQADMDKLAEFYRKNNLEISESLPSAVVSGALFGGLMMNPRFVAHPINSVRATFSDDLLKMFEGVRKEGTALNKLWKENHTVMEEAYFQMHKAWARSKGKLGFVRGKYTEQEYKMLKNIMQEAINSGDVNKIAEASAKLKAAYVNNGWWNKGLHKIGLKSEVPSVLKGLENNELIKTTTKEILEGNKMTFSKALQKAGLKGSILFAGIEIATNLGKIKTAFSKDNETGMKQLGQTTVKAVGNAAGWAVGEAAGIWAAAALGAKIGTCFGPGVGTVIGGLAGLIGGSIGMWLTGKATKAIVGEDVANKIEVDNMKKTVEGQKQLLTYTAQKAQEGGLDKNTAIAFKRLASQYA